MCERSHTSLAVLDIISSFQHVAVVAKESGCNVMPPSRPLTKGAWSCAHHHGVFNLTRPPRPEEESSASFQISLSPASERKEETFFQSKRKLQSPQLPDSTLTFTWIGWNGQKKPECYQRNFAKEEKALLLFLLFLLLLLLLSSSLMGSTRSSNLELCKGERKNTPRPVGNSFSSSWIFSGK